MSELLRTADRAVVRLRGLAAFALSVWVAVLALTTLLLLGRGMAGYFVESLGFTAALLTGFTVAIASWLLRTAVNVGSMDEQQRRALLGTVVTTTWLFIVAITCSPMTSLGVLALWLPMIAMESAWWVLPPEAPLLTLATENAAAVTTRSPPPSLPRVEPDTNVVQQLTRLQEGGGETIRGVAQIEFTADEQTAVLHLVFSPPLKDDPQVTINDISATGVSVKAAECRSYGLRLEAKRGRETSQPLTVRVEFQARA